MFDRILLVLEITVPVFGMIGLGKILQVKKILSDDARHSLNNIISNFSLPAIIFLAISRASFEKLFNLPIIVGGLSSVILGVLVFLLFSKIMRIKGEERAPFLYAPFWANVSYMGIPLAVNAFEKTGELNAAIINAFVMPVYVITGTFLIYFYSEKQEEGSMGKRIRYAFLNPITIAAFLGIFASLAADLAGLRDIFNDSKLLHAGTSIIVRFIELIGKIGLPAALLSVGAALHVSSSAKRMIVLGVCCFGKLALTPLLSLFVIKLFFPETAPEDIGSCVLIMATPNAVASYVISTRAGVAEDEASALVVWTTLLSIIAIPIWTFFLI